MGQIVVPLQISKYPGLTLEQIGNMQDKKCSLQCRNDKTTQLMQANPLAESRQRLNFAQFFAAIVFAKGVVE